MRLFFRQILLLVKREVKIVTSDKTIAALIFAAPVFFGLFYSTVYLNKIETDVPVGIINLDGSMLSAGLVRNLDASQSISITHNYNSIEEIINAVYSDEIQAGIIIPSDFTANLKGNKAAVIKVYLNTTKFLVSNDINKAVNEVTLTMGAAARLKYFKIKGNNSEQSMELIEPLKLEINNMFNFTESYGDFIMPGLLVLIIQQTLLLGLSLSAAKENEFDTFGEMLKITGGSPLKLITGKISFYILLFFGYTVLFYTVLFPIFKLNFKAPAVVVFLVSIINLIAVSTFSLFIGSFFKSRLIVLHIVAFTSLPFFLFSGFSWPAESMPVLIRYLSFLIPGTHYLKYNTLSVSMGASLKESAEPVFYLSIIAVVYFIATYFRMKHLSKKYHSAEAEM